MICRRPRVTYMRHAVLACSSLRITNLRQSITCIQLAGKLFKIFWAGSRRRACRPPQLRRPRWCSSSLPGAAKWPWTKCHDGIAAMEGRCFRQAFPLQLHNFLRIYCGKTKLHPEIPPSWQIYRHPLSQFYLSLAGSWKTKLQDM